MINGTLPVGGSVLQLNRKVPQRRLRRYRMLQCEIQIIVPLGGSNCKMNVSVAIVLVSKASIYGMDNRAIEKTAC
jgi:hypothetical protein